jgi:UDP:flavonoid glycosyltransferase YjiC (YdhE family)
MAVEILPRINFTTRTGRRSRVPYRIYISANGEGYGHSSRVLAVARYLDPECVLLGSYGYVLERFRRAGYNTVEVGPEVKFFGEDGSFELSKTILKNSTWPLVINKQTREELRIIKRFGANCVLSDCRAASIFAAAKLDLPSIYMTNQTQFDHFFKRRGMREYRDGRELDLADILASELGAKAIGEAILSQAAEPSVELAVKAIFKQLDDIVIADFAPPDTVCLPVLSHKNEVKKLQRMVGPVVGWRADEVIPYPRPSSGPYVVGTLGGHQYRLPLFHALIEAARLLPHVHFDIFSSFNSADIPPNLRVMEFTDNPERYYKAADLVVTQAGHSTAMELLTLGKQSLLVPDFKQIEQESNANRMVDLGVSSQLTYPELSGPFLAASISHHLKTRVYEASALRLARLAAQLDGARRVAEIVTDYAMRMLAY